MLPRPYPYLAGNNAEDMCIVDFREEQPDAVRAVRRAATWPSQTLRGIYSMDTGQEQGKNIWASGILRPKICLAGVAHPVGLKPVYGPPAQILRPDRTCACPGSKRILQARKRKYRPYGEAFLPPGSPADLSPRRQDHHTEPSALPRPSRNPPSGQEKDDSPGQPALPPT